MPQKQLERVLTTSAPGSSLDYGSEPLGMGCQHQYILKALQTILLSGLRTTGQRYEHGRGWVR